MRSRPVSRGQPQPLQLCIAELLRTCIYPPTLVLRVEKILKDDGEESRLDGNHAQPTTTRGTCKSTYKLCLGDGEIMIQALLAPHLHPLIDLQETNEGSLIELRDYSIRKARRRSGKGEVIYFGVEDYVCITLSRPTTSEAHNEVLVNGGGFMLEEDTIIAQQQSSTHIQVPSSPLVGEMPQQIPSSQESCAYETITIELETAKRRRQALHKMSSNRQAKRRREVEEDDIPIKRRRPQTEELASSQDTDPFETIEGDPETLKGRRLALHELSNNNLSRGERNDENTPTKNCNHEAEENASTSNPVSHNADETLTQVPSIGSTPRHTLLSLLHPPAPLPPRNYPVTILAVVSWISPTVLHQPGSPFPPKRTLKLHDPSITDRQVGVSISVFIDAATFTPRHGTIALFQGVVMQMWRDEVILNAYPNLRGGEWYVDDGRDLEAMGYDVKGMRVWWEERKRLRGAEAARGKCVPGRGD